MEHKRRLNSSGDGKGLNVGSQGSAHRSRACAECDARRSRDMRGCAGWPRGFVPPLLCRRQCQATRHAGWGSGWPGADVAPRHPRCQPDLWPAGKSGVRDRAEVPRLDSSHIPGHPGGSPPAASIWPEPSSKQYRKAPTSSTSAAASCHQTARQTPCCSALCGCAMRTTYLSWRRRATTAAPACMFLRLFRPCLRSAHSARTASLMNRVTGGTHTGRTACWRPARGSRARLPVVALQP